MFRIKLIISLILAAVISIGSVSTSNAAKKVYINGMDMSKYLLTNITLKCVTIKFDAKGNLYIVAKGYNFKPSKKTQVAKPQKGDKLANKFYLVTFPRPAKVNLGYHIDLLINGKFVKRVYSNSGQMVYDVTSSLKKGKNTVAFVSKKKAGKLPAKGSMKLAIAKGYESKGTYIIKNILWEIKRSSLDKKSSYFDKKIITKK
jgi:hypothetical protein